MSSYEGYSMLKELLEYEEAVRRINKGVDQALDKASQEEPEPTEPNEGEEGEKPDDGKEDSNKKEG